MYKTFMVTLADVFSKIKGGEMERIIDHCRKAGMDWKEIGNLRRGYWRRMARVHHPPPKQLLEEVFDVYVAFKDLQDPENPDRKFFVSDHEKILLKMCAYVQIGFLSNPVKYPLLGVKVKVLSTGFEVFRKLSNTAALEAFHHPWAASSTVLLNMVVRHTVLCHQHKLMQMPSNW